MNPDETSSVYLSLIIPAYNEAEHIASTLETVETYLGSVGRRYEIICVDDGSTDDTATVAKDYAAQSEAVRIISYSRNAGKGYAVRQGVAASRGDYVAFSDVDLSAPIEELAKLGAAMDKGYDAAIGSRAIKGAQIGAHQPFYRELGGKALNLIIQLLAVSGIWDTQCGFKLFRGDQAREVFRNCILDGWAFDVEVLYLLRKLGCRIAEVPVKWDHSPDSKINPLLGGLQVIRDLFRIRMHRYDLQPVE